ncbi:MAG: patatin-like phospholipase family protein [Thiotrichales bacterium]|nr:patatin-like phospholipase family protein [Thiotrichales bacterium]
MNDSTNSHTSDNKPKTSPKPASQNTKTISLVLGSGGARGLAHIGIIRWLEEHHYQIKVISGSSIGALIGGIYAAGKLDEFERWLTNLSKTDILALMDIAWDRSGLIKGDKLNSMLKDLLGEPNIEDLAIPFTAVATDINHEKEVWLQSGSLLNAMRASYSLPMIFTPQKYQGLTLVDGGVLNPVPIAPTFGESTELTIAVNLGAKPSIHDTKPCEEAESDRSEETTNKNAPSSEQNDGLIEWSAIVDSVKAFFSREKSKLKQPFNWDAYDISNKAFDSMQSSIARQKLAAYPPDITLNVPRDACGMLEFTRVKEMIELGYQTAQASLGDENRAQ